MAKAKNTEVKEPVVEEEIKAEVVEEVVVEDTHDDFLTRKLKIVNSLDNPLKAQRIADRLLRKRR